MDVQPTLRDGVIQLTAFSLRDLPALLEANSDPEMARRFDFPPGAPQAEPARRAVRGWQRGWRTRRRVAFAIRPSGSTELLGGCEVRVHADGIASISYFTVPERRRHGLATRAVRLLTEFAFTKLSVERLEIRAEVDNVASATVAERAGFEREGVLRAAGAYRRGRRDMVLYARVRNK